MKGEKYYECPLCGDKMKYSHTHWDEHWNVYEGYTCINCGYCEYD